MPRPLPVVAHAADEALGELRRPPRADAGGRRLGLLRARRRRGVDVRLAGHRLRDERVAVLEQEPLAVPADRQRPLERRRKAERHLGGGAEARAEQPGRVAAVRGGAAARDSGGRS